MTHTCDIHGRPWQPCPSCPHATPGSCPSRRHRAYCDHHRDQPEIWDPIIAAQPAEDRPPRQASPGPPPSPVWPRPRGVLRVGWLTPTLGQGGAEQWIATMVAALDPTKIQPVGVVQIYADDRGDLLRPVIEQTCPVGVGWDAARSLDRAVDVLVTWGLPETAAHLAEHGPRHAKLVIVSHGNVGEWSRKASAGCEQADELIAVSRWAAEGFPDEVQDRVRIMPNGVDPARVVPQRSRAEVRAELGIADDAKVLLMISRLSTEKRPQALPMAIARLPEPWVGVQAGIDCGMGALIDLLIEERCPGRVKLLGPRNDIADLYAMSDVFMLPSQTEGQSLALIEAMLAGVPAVCTPVGTVPEHPELVRVIDWPAKGEEIAAAVLADAADPVGTRARALAAQTHATEHWTTVAFGCNWMDYLLSLAPPEPSSVPLAVKAVHFAQALAQHVAAGCPETPPEVLDARRAVCREAVGLPPEQIQAGHCDHYRPSDDTCGGRGGCGCGTAAKAAWADQSCPFGRWTR